VAKDAIVSARVEKSVKSEAEDILQQLGLPVSVVINALYRQIILQKSIPFDISVPKAPKALEDMTEEELNARLEKGLREAKAGQGRPADEVFAEILADLRSQN